MKTRKEDGDLHESAKTQRADKPTRIRCIVYPRNGGAPYYEDVEPEKGYLTLEDSSLSYSIAPGSVWREPDGRYRTIINEGNPQTIHAASLVGDDALTPEALHGTIWNNLWWQYDDETRSRSPWVRAGMFSLGIFAVLLLGVMVWAIFSIGGDLESIRQALEGIEVNSGRGPSTAAEQAGHQDIAPGGS